MMFLFITIAVHLALLFLLLGDRWLQTAILAAYGVYHGSIAWAVLYPRSRLFGPNRSRLDTQERVVALTFDDGPHPTVTPRLLAILRERGIQATFFLVGKWAERHPEIVRQIVADGHVLGNHSHEHSYLFWAYPPARLGRDVQRAQRILETTSGKPCRWFRGPVGMKNCFLHRVLKRQGLELVSWDVRFLDRKVRKGEDLTRRLRKRVVPGSILMLHDGHDRRPEGNPAVLECLPSVLTALDALGYRCVLL